MAQTDLPPLIADALAKGDAPALQALAQSADRDLKKSAKRALHLLRAKGVVVAEPLRASSPAAPRPLTPEETPEPVRLTAFDGGGERAFFVPIKAPTGYVLHVGIFSDAGQLRDLRAHDLSRRQLKNYFASLPDETQADLRELPAAEAMSVIARTLENAEGALGPSARALLAQLPPAKGPTRPVAALDPARLAETAELFKTAPFARTLPEREVIVALSQKLEEIVVSPLYIDEPQRLAQLRVAVERAIADYFTSDRRQRFAARADAAAELFEARDEQESAARADALAAALRSEREILSIPFARAYFERILNLEAASKLGGPQAETPAPSTAPAGLIVAP